MMRLFFDLPRHGTLQTFSSHHSSRSPPQSYVYQAVSDDQAPVTKVELDRTNILIRTRQLRLAQENKIKQRVHVAIAGEDDSHSSNKRVCASRHANQGKTRVPVGHSHRVVHASPSSSSLATLRYSPPQQPSAQPSGRPTRKRRRDRPQQGPPGPSPATSAGLLGQLVGGLEARGRRRGRQHTGASDRPSQTIHSRRQLARLLSGVASAPPFADRDAVTVPAATAAAVLPPMASPPAARRSDHGVTAESFASPLPTTVQALPEEFFHSPPSSAHRTFASPGLGTGARGRIRSVDRRRITSPTPLERRQHHSPYRPRRPRR